MLNVMEERDIQIRGYVLRLPLDVLVVASANPEDYTNRGRIITPLKDRFGAEIRTHYPPELDDEIAVIRQEAHLVGRRCPTTSSRSWPASPATCASPAPSTSAPASARASRSPAPRPSRPRRCTARPCRARTTPVARVVDLETAVDVLGGKIEFESGEEGREREMLTHLLRTAIAETVRQHLRGIDLAPARRRDRGRLDDHDRRAGQRPRLPGRAARAGRVRPLRPGHATGSAPPTTASAPRRSSSRSRGSTWPARSARRPAAGRPSMAEVRADIEPLPPVRRRRPAGAAGRPRRGARRHRPGRDGRLLARAGDAGVPAPRRSGPAWPRRPGPPGRRAAPRPAAPPQPRRHDARGPRAPRQGRARRARPAGPRRGDGRRRPRLPRDAARQPAGLDGGRGERAGVVRLAERRGPRGLRGDQGPARPRAARPAVRRHEAGARGRHRRGPGGGQRDARRPQRAAGEARAGRGHRAGLPRLHGQARGLLPRAARRTSTSCSTRSPSAPRPPSGCSAR